MEPENPNPTQAPPVALVPPTEATPLPVAAPASNWPTALGIIAIIFGAGAILSTAGTIASTKWSDWQYQHMDANVAAKLQAAQAKWQPLTLASSSVYCVLGILLLYAGILLLRRRRSVARLVRWWAGLKIVYVMGSSVIGYFVMQDTMAAMATSTPGMPGQMHEGFAIFGIAFALLWGCALPIFMLIWFARERIKQEVSRWS